MAREPRRLARGTNAQVMAYTGPAGEPIYNTETGALHMQDGVTPGGRRTPLADEIPDPAAAMQYTSRAAAIAATVPVLAEAIRILGYTVPGDGGAGIYKRLGSAPSPAKPWHFQSTDGAWWELAEPVVTPEHFGAKGDGVSDDTVALNNALLFTSKVMARRHYKTSATITLGAGGVANQLDGAGTGRIFCSVNNIVAVAIKGGILGYRVEGISIERTVTPVAGGHGLVVSTADPAVVGTTQSTLFHNIRVAGHWDGVRIGTTDYSEFADSVIESNYRHGVYMTCHPTYGAAQWQLRNILAQFNDGCGFYFEPTAGATSAILGEWVGLKTFANTQGGIWAVGNPGCPVYDVRILGGFIGADGGDEVYLDTYGGNHLIQNLFMEYSGEHQTGPGTSKPPKNVGNGINITANNNLIEVSNCVFLANAYHGIESRGTNVVISNNLFQSNGRVKAAGYRAGIYVEGAHSVVSGNISGNLNGGDSQEWGMIAGIDSVCVTGNNFTRNNLGGLYIASAANSVITGNLPKSINVP